MTTDNTLERWRPVIAYPGYEVSNMGRVRSVDREVVGRHGLPLERTIGTAFDRGGGGTVRQVGTLR